MAEKEIILKHRVQSCNHCAAYADSYCQLGYETERLKKEDYRLWHHFTTWDDAVIKIKPAEPCPKPKNISEKVFIRSKLDVYRKYKWEPSKDIMMTEEESKEHYIRFNKDDL